jgi:hypothetical protein
MEDAAVVFAAATVWQDRAHGQFGIGTLEEAGSPDNGILSGARCELPGGKRLAAAWRGGNLAADRWQCGYPDQLACGDRLSAHLLGGPVDKSSGWISEAQEGAHDTTFSRRSLDVPPTCRPSIMLERDHLDSADSDTISLRDDRLPAKQAAREARHHLAP